MLQEEQEDKNSAATLARWQVMVHLQSGKTSLHDGNVKMALLMHRWTMARMKSCPMTSCLIGTCKPDHLIHKLPGTTHAASRCAAEMHNRTSVQRASGQVCNAHQDGAFQMQFATLQASASASSIVRIDAYSECTSQGGTHQVFRATLPYNVLILSDSRGKRCYNQCF